MRRTGICPVRYASRRAAYMHVCFRSTKLYQNHRAGVQWDKRDARKDTQGFQVGRSGGRRRDRHSQDWTLAGAVMSLQATQKAADL